MRVWSVKNRQSRCFWSFLLFFSPKIVLLPQFFPPHYQSRVKRSIERPRIVCQDYFLELALYSVRWSNGAAATMVLVRMPVICSAFTTKLYLSKLGLFWISAPRWKHRLLWAIQSQPQDYSGGRGCKLFGVQVLVKDCVSKPTSTTNRNARSTSKSQSTLVL